MEAIEKKTFTVQGKDFEFAKASNVTGVAATSLKDTELGERLFQNYSGQGFDRQLLNMPLPVYPTCTFKPRNGDPKPYIGVVVAQFDKQGNFIKLSVTSVNSLLSRNEVYKGEGHEALQTCPIGLPLTNGLILGEEFEKLVKEKTIFEFDHDENVIPLRFMDTIGGTADRRYYKADNTKLDCQRRAYWKKANRPEAITDELYYDIIRIATEIYGKKA